MASKRQAASNGEPMLIFQETVRSLRFGLICVRPLYIKGKHPLPILQSHAKLPQSSSDGCILQSLSDIDKN